MSCTLGIYRGSPCFFPSCSSLFDLAGEVLSVIMIMDVVVYADVLCPWCYVQKKSLQNAMDRYEVRHPGVEFNVTWKPFLLHPTLQRGKLLAVLPPTTETESWAGTSEATIPNTKDAHMEDQHY